jgi:hypothetical protein
MVEFLFRNLCLLGREGDNSPMLWEGGMGYGGIKGRREERIEGRT